MENQLEHSHSQLLNRGAGQLFSRDRKQFNRMKSIDSPVAPIFCAHAAYARADLQAICSFLHLPFPFCYLHFTFSQ
jgi:hypothetical protein